jgi:hypothetical protein
VVSRCVAGGIAGGIAAATGGMPPATRWKVWCEREHVVGERDMEGGGWRGRGYDP